MAEGHSGRLRPSGAARRGFGKLLLAPMIVVTFAGVAAADPVPVDPQYPPKGCETTQTLRATPDTIDDAALPAKVTVAGTGFPSSPPIDASQFTPPPKFDVTILLDGAKVATAQGASFSVSVTIPQGVASTVTISAVSDDFAACRASTVIRLGCLERSCLPRTGSDTSGMLWLGLTTLALGAAMAVGARRRTHAPERRRAALVGAGSGAGMSLAVAPVPQGDDVLSAFAPTASSAPVSAAVLDSFATDEQLTLLAPTEAVGPPDAPAPSMGEAVEQLRSLFARLARDD